MSNSSSSSQFRNSIQRIKIITMNFLAIVGIILALIKLAISQNWPFPTFSYPQPYSQQPFPQYNQQYPYYQQPYPLYNQQSTPQYSGSTLQRPYQQWPYQQSSYYPDQNSRNNQQPSENFNSHTVPATTATPDSSRPIPSQTISSRQTRISVESKKKI